jgi:hypothetical protein
MFLVWRETSSKPPAGKGILGIVGRFVCGVYYALSLLNFATRW